MITQSLSGKLNLKENTNPDIVKKVDHLYNELIKTEESYNQALTQLFAQDNKEADLLIKAFNKLSTKDKEGYSTEKLQRTLEAIGEIQKISTQLIQAFQQVDFKAMRQLLKQLPELHEAFLFFYNVLPKTFKPDKNSAFPLVQNINNILVTPMQRLPRYVLLFEDLHKSLPQHKEIEKLFNTSKAIAHQVNTSKRTFDETQPINSQITPPISDEKNHIKKRAQALITHASKKQQRIAHGALTKLFNINHGFVKTLYDPLKVQEKRAAHARLDIVKENLTGLLRKKDLGIKDIHEALHNGYPALFSDKNAVWSSHVEERTQWLHSLIDAMNEVRLKEKQPKIASEASPERRPKAK